MTDAEYNTTGTVLLSGWTLFWILTCLYVGVFRGPMP